MKQSVTVYCGSSSGNNPVFLEQATALGRLLARAGVEVITGAGAAGLMRAVADGALAEGGSVHGIIPAFMVDRGWHYDALTTTTVTDSMHRRKELMAGASIAAVALPGGVGTWEEFMEIVTWKQLGLFPGNIILLNVGGYYDPVVEMFRKGAVCGFLKSDHLNLFSVAYSAEEAVRLALSEPIQSFSPKL